MPAREDEIGALWIRESKKDGSKFLSGKMSDGTEIVMFKNSHKKEGEKGPDYRIYRSTPRPQTQAKPQSTPQPQANQDDFDPFA